MTYVGRKIDRNTYSGVGDEGYVVRYVERRSITVSHGSNIDRCFTFIVEPEGASLRKPAM